MQEPIETGIPTQTPASSTEDLDREITAESTVILYRGVPTSAFGHVVASSFVCFGLEPVTEFSRLLLWWLVMVTATCTRLGFAFTFLRRWPDISDDRIGFWSQSFFVMALAQTCLWGAGAVFLWPDSIAYRSLLVAVLSGVIAASSITLAIHRQSFWIYCLPIAAPTLYMLLTLGGRLEYTLAALLVLFSGLLLVTVNNLASMFIEGIKLRSALEALSRTDPLTQLANRRGFDEFLNEIWHQSVRTSQAIGYLLIDVDKFKDYNDRYGHPRGDEALRQLADVLRQVASRSTDMCARIGGEEFVILMAATDQEGSLQVAAEVQSQLSKENIVYATSPTGSLTVSIGINSLVPGRDTSLETFIEAQTRPSTGRRTWGETG